MASYTGAEIIAAALREIQVIDPADAVPGDLQANAKEALDDLLDTWADQQLFVRGVTRSVYSLTSGTQTYTIGSGGTFNQTYPSEIKAWSVIPDDTATDLLERPYGRPDTYDQWQRIRNKDTQSSHPTRMWFDKSYTAGLGNCLFWPIPNKSTVDVVLYTLIPQIESIVLTTTYDLPRGYHRAIKLNGALELADRYGKAAQVTPRLEMRAEQALAAIKRKNKIPSQSAVRPEFVIQRSQRRGAYNLYVDD